MADEYQNHTIEVSGADLAYAMKIASTGTRGLDEVRIESTNNELVVSGPGASMRIGAKGSWDGYAFVPAKLLHAAVRRLEDKTILRLRVENGRFYMNTFSIAARYASTSACASGVAVGVPASVDAGVGVGSSPPLHAAASSPTRARISTAAGRLSTGCLRCAMGRTHHEMLARMIEILNGRRMAARRIASFLNG